MSEACDSFHAHIVKCKGKNALRINQLNGVLKRFVDMFRRQVRYLHKFNMLTGKKELTKFGLGASVVLQLREKLNDSWEKLLLRKLTHNFLCGIGASKPETSI